MSNVWATMPYVQLSHKMFVICINNRQNQIFSEMSLRDVMELSVSPIPAFNRTKSVNSSVKLSYHNIMLPICKYGKNIINYRCMNNDNNKDLCKRRKWPNFVSRIFSNYALYVRELN